MATVYFVRSQGFWVVLPTRSLEVAKQECAEAQKSAPVMLHVLDASDEDFRATYPAMTVRETT